MPQNKEEILSRVNIEQVIIELIPEAKHNTAILSPLRDEKNPSFSIDLQTGLWKDHGTNQSGDLFALIQELRGEDFKGALAYLAAKGGTILNATKPNKIENITKPDKGQKPISKKEMEQYRANCRKDAYPIIKHELEKRGLTVEQLDIFSIGIRKQGQAQEAFILPYKTDDAGNVIEYKIIAYNSKSKKQIISGAKATLFPAYNLKYAKLVLCEGELDVLAFRQYGLNAITGTSGAGSFNEKMAERFVGKDIIVLYDSDTAGQEGAQKAAELLSKTANSVKIAVWDINSKGYDACDFSGSRRTLEELSLILNRAVPFRPKNGSLVEEQTTENVQQNCREAKDYIFVKGRYRENRAAQYLYEKVYRNDKNEPTICCYIEDKKNILCLYKNGFWMPVPDKYIIKKLIQLVHDNELHFSDANLKATISMLKALVLREEDLRYNNSQYINLQNCAFDLHDMKAISHNPDHDFIYKNSYDYVADAKCPFTDSVFCEYSGHDTKWVNLLWEFIGLCLTDDTSFQSILFMLGPGGTGKGTVVRIMTELVGINRTLSDFKLNELDSRFYLLELRGKHLAVAPDIAPKIPNVHRLKALSGQDIISSDQKYGSMMTIVNKAKIVLVSNSAPDFGDEHIQSICRRLIPISFDVPIKKRDPYVEKRMFLELPGIFNRAIEGYRRLKRQDGFTIPDSTGKLLKQIQSDSPNLVEDFFVESLVADSNSSVYIKEIWNAYVKYMDNLSVQWRNKDTNITNSKALGKKMNQTDWITKHISGKSMGRYTDQNNGQSTVTTNYHGLRLRRESDPTDTNLRDY